jgi:hypothetical protein
LGLIIASLIEGFGKRQYRQGVTYPPTLDLFEARVVNLLSEVRDYTKGPANGKAIRPVYLQEHYFTHIISDVRSELAMIHHVLEQQEHILNNLLDDRAPAAPATVNEESTGPADPRDPPDWTPVENARETLGQYKRRVKKIDGDAERIEKSIQDMLNLKRTHASIKDAHSSLIVSTAVIGFTVITIVFAPLAFLTALFALKIDGFEKLYTSGKDAVFNSDKMGGIFGKCPISDHGCKRLGVRMLSELR